MGTVIYPGTFDPVTNGHLDIITRSLKIFGNVIVAIGQNPNKNYLFNIRERIEMIQESLPSSDGIEIDTFDGLLMEYAKSKSVSTVIRGLRAVSDFEYEFQMALMNRTLNESVETIFLLPSEKYVYLTSSIVKEVAKHNGDISGLVTPFVLKKLKERFQQT